MFDHGRIEIKKESFISEASSNRKNIFFCCIQECNLSFFTTFITSGKELGKWRKKEMMNDYNVLTIKMRMTTRPDFDDDERAAIVPRYE